jgi:hypothetical protein
MLASVEPHKDVLGGFADGGLVDVVVGPTFHTFMLHCSWFKVTLQDSFEVERRLIVAIWGYQ